MCSLTALYNLTGHVFRFSQGCSLDGGLPSSFIAENEFSDVSEELAVFKIQDP